MRETWTAPSSGSPTATPRDLVTDELRDRMRLRIVKNVERPSAAPTDSPAAPPIRTVEPIAPPVIEPVVQLQIIEPVPELVPEPVVELPIIEPVPEPIVELPTIIVPSMPVLGQPSRAPAPARRPESAGQNAPDHTSVSPASRGSKPKRVNGPKGKQKRRPFRAFFTLLVVAALLGAAAYGGWYVLLKSKVSWAADVAPVAEHVEAAMHHQFSENVPVLTLAVPEYEAMLGRSVLANAYADSTGELAALRAVGLVGLVGQATDPTTIGHLVGAVRPTFYDRATSSVYRVEGVTPLFQLSLANSLTLALADQRTHWSTGFDALTDAQRTGLLATVDALASRVVETVATAMSVDLAAVAAERTQRGDAVGLSGDQIPVVAALAISSADGGGALRPLPPAEDPLAGFAIPPDDANALDPARDVTSTPAVAPPSSADGMPGRTLGIQFWYAALVPVVGVDPARGAALAWAADSSTISIVNGGFACLTANIVTTDEPGQAVLGGALMQLAQSRPASSLAAVSTLPGNVISVSMCQPAEAEPSKVASLAVGAIFSTARAEANLASGLTANGLPATPKAWRCAVLARRGGALTDYSVGTTDPAILEQMTAITQFCSTP